MSVIFKLWNVIILTYQFLVLKITCSKEFKFMFQVICSVHISHMTFDGYGFNSVCFALFVQNSVSTQNHLTCDNLNVFANLSLQNAFRHVVYVFELWSRKLRCLRVAKLQLILSVFTMLGNKTPDLQSYLSTKTNIVF